MKSTVNGEPAKPTIRYPSLWRAKSTGRIVIKVREGHHVAVVVHDAVTSHLIGSMVDSGSFTEYLSPGEVVTLRND